MRRYSLKVVMMDRFIEKSYSELGYDILKKLFLNSLMKLSGISQGKVMVEKGLQSYELKQVFHGKTSVMCIVKLSFPFSRWRVSKVGESEQEMHRIRPTHIQASRSLCLLAHTHSNNVKHSVPKLVWFSGSV